MAAPTITDAPDAPTRGEDPETFASKANNFVSWQANSVSEYNALGAYVEEKANDIGDSASVIQDGDAVYAADTGSADTYVMTLPGLSAYSAGQMFRFKAANTNTGASTLNINSLGAVAIKRPNGSALEADDIQADQIIVVVHDGTSFQLATINAPPAVTGYTAATHMYLLDKGPDSDAAYDIDANLAHNTFESIGPTGSGADNIWTELDALPSGAKFLLLNVSLSSTDNGGETTSAAVSFKKNGTAAPTNPALAIGHSVIFGSALSGSVNLLSYGEVLVPLNSMVFDAKYNTSSFNESEAISITIKGFYT